MPTYDYRCKHCGHKFEAFQSITDKPLVKCPQCGKRALRRLIGTGAGVIFKGSGFYATDYKSVRSGNAKSAASDSNPPTSAGADTGDSAASPDSGDDSK